MIKLTSNEEKVRKELMKFPHGVKARILIDECRITKSPMYVALNGLENKNLAYRGDHNLWYPEKPMKKESCDNQINLIKEEYVKGLVDSAFNRLFLLLRSKNSSAKLTREIEQLFQKLYESQEVLKDDLEIIRRDPIQSGNFDRQKRMIENNNKIKKLKMRIIVTALKDQ